MNDIIAGGVHLKLNTFPSDLNMYSSHNVTHVPTINTQSDELFNSHFLSLEVVLPHCDCKLL